MGPAHQRVYDYIRRLTTKIKTNKMFRPTSLYYTDGYKIGHKAMLADGTDFLYGTWIPRSTKHAPKGISKIVSFGQQLTW